MSGLEKRARVVEVDWSVRRVPNFRFGKRNFHTSRRLVDRLRQLDDKYRLSFSNIDHWENWDFVDTGVF